MLGPAPIYPFGADVSGSTVLVTGGAGYIGSHAVLALQDARRSVVVVDDLSTGIREAVPSDAVFIAGDAGDADLIRSVIAQYDVGVVMHFAGSTSPPESLLKPIEYYTNNTVVSLRLARACIDAGVHNLIFSSSAAVYGLSGCSPFRETGETSPTTPYGASKLMTELMLRDLSRAYPGFRSISLRYFNVAGADPKGRAGQRREASPSLIDLAVDVALGQREWLDIWGDDYDTRDGSGERDYVHVSDLAEAHVAAARHLESGADGGVFNCGYGRGYTVLEVVAALEEVVGRRIQIRRGPRRAGDIGGAVANVERLTETLCWRPQYADLQTILRSVLAWRGWSGD